VNVHYIIFYLPISKSHAVNIKIIIISLYILLQDMVKRRGAYRVLVGKSEGKRPL